MNEYTSTLRSDSKRGSPFNKSTFPAQFKLSTDQNDGDKKKPELAAPFKTVPDSEGEDLLSAKGDKKAKSDTSRAPRKSNKPTTITPLAHGYYIFRFSISSPRGNVRQIICFDLHSIGLSSLYYRLYILNYFVLGILSITRSKSFFDFYCESSCPLINATSTEERPQKNFAFSASPQRKERGKWAHIAEIDESAHHSLSAVRFLGPDMWQPSYRVFRVTFEHILLEGRRLSSCQIAKSAKWNVGKGQKSERISQVSRQIFWLVWSNNKI